MLARLLDEALGVFVWNLYRKFAPQFVNRRKYRRRVGKLGKHDETHRQKRCGARNSRVDHRDHPLGVAVHRPPVERIRVVSLAGSSRISNQVGDHRWPPGMGAASTGTERVTTRVLYRRT